MLHCLGVCMILWALFRKRPNGLLALVGGILVALGLWFKTLTVQTKALFWLGLLYEGFSTSDYFPLLPFLGFFLLGAWLGRVLYREKASLLPGFRCKPLEWIGRHSLLIYMLHQPILTGLLFVIYYVKL